MTSLRIGIPDGPTLGQMIRARRLGWYWASRCRAFIRMRDLGERVSVECHPAGYVPDGRGSWRNPLEHIVWWEDEQLLDLIRELRGVRRVKRPIYFEVPKDRDISAEKARLTHGASEVHAD